MATRSIKNDPRRVNIETYDGPRYQPIKECHELTGLAISGLRAGARNGTLKCAKSGNKYYLDMYDLLERADRNDLVF